MSDIQNLKNLAEAFPTDLDWDSNTEPFFNGPSGESLGGGATGFYSVYGAPFKIDGDDYEYEGPTYVEACTADFAKFMVSARAGVLGLAADLERVTAEREALQQRLTTADQRIDDLETQLDCAQDHLGAAWDALHAEGIASPGTLSVAEGIAMLLQSKRTAADQRTEGLTELLNKALLAIKYTYQAGRDRIVDMGGDCDSVETMMNSDLTVQEIRTALKPAVEACEFPQSCTSRSDCDSGSIKLNDQRWECDSCDFLAPENDGGLDEGASE